MTARQRRIGRRRFLRAFRALPADLVVVLPIDCEVRLLTADDVPESQGGGESPWRSGRSVPQR